MSLVMMQHNGREAIMSIRTIRTAVAEYDDGSEGVLEVNKLKPDSGDSFMTISAQHGDDSLVVATQEQARQLANAIRAAAKEIWN